MSTTTERIADLRENAAIRGEDVTNLSDVELLLREYDRANKEACDTRHKVQALLTERAKWERRVYSAARRNAQDDRVAWADHYLRSLVSTAQQPITGLVYRVTQLPDRAGPKQITALKAAAQEASEAIEYARKTADQAPEIDLTSKQRAEIDRLRQYVMAAGQALHKAMAQDGARCECAGCELVVGLDVVPAELREEMADA